MADYLLESVSLMTKLGAILIPLAAAIMTYAPTLAHACAVCFDSEDNNRQAFVDTTIFLTILPLLMLGLGIYLVVRRVRKAEREEALRQEAFLKSQQLFKHNDSQAT